jgi:hypothetical protein
VFEVLIWKVGIIGFRPRNVRLRSHHIRSYYSHSFGVEPKLEVIENKDLHGR